MRQRGASAAWFLLVCAIAVAFIWFTSRQLPALVANHFAQGGIANGFIQHRSYVITMMVACVLLPFVIVFPIVLALSNPNIAIKVPNADYWLAPERRADTVAFLRTQMMRLGTGLLIFICYVHWLLIKANTLSPPRLAAGPFVSAVTVFIGFVIVWAAIHYTRFRKPA